MRVIIEEREYEYLPDFPNGWKFSEGAYSKFPVQIGSNKCFIKRFEKSPESISGSGLLKNLKGKNATGLAKIYDVVETNEQGKNIFYVFQKFIEGETLDKLIAGKAAVNLATLTDDLFAGLQSLNQNHYWFADFCEKNIFCDNNRRFLLTGLDNAQPISETSNNEMSGSKDYWNLVFDFYTNVLGQTQLRASDFNGNSFNYLEVIFLILRLKIFYSDREIEYDSSIFLNHLPFYLNNISPLFKRVFNNAVKHARLPLDQRDINEIKYLIKEKIISLTNPNIFTGKKIPSIPKPVIHEITENNYSGEKEDEYKSALIKEEEVHEPTPEIPPVPNPVISEFTAANYVEKTNNEYIVENGKAFKLRWKVENAVNVELYRNGAPYRKFDMNEENIELTEKTNDGNSTIEYKLIASNDNESVTKYLVIRFVYLNPVINEFTVADHLNKDNNDFLVETGKPFKLRWEAQNVSNIQLFKNGKLLQKFDRNEKNITLKEEIQNGRSKTIEYTLVASNDNESVTKYLVIRLVYPNPVINEFTLTDFFNKEDDFLVETGKPFKLKWEVQNALYIELFRNGNSYRKFNKDEKNITLKEETQNGSKRIEYTLVASNDNESIASKSLAIRFVHLNPAINQFTVSHYFEREGNEFVVENRKPFILQWNVQYATNIELYKDGNVYKQFNNAEKNIQLTEEIHDGKSKKIEYTLVASKNNEPPAQRSLIIKVIYPEPVINQFKANKYVVKEGKAFQLIWNVKNASVLKLFKNGQLYETLNPTEESRELTEKTYDGKREIEYSLLASNGFVEKQSEPVIITLKPASPPVIKKLIPVFLGVLLLSLILFFFLRSHPAEIYPFTQQQIAENNTITISGKHLPTSKGSVQVNFNDKAGVITQQTEEKLNVQVPKVSSGKSYVTIHVNISGKPFTAADHVLFTPGNLPASPLASAAVSLPPSLIEIWHNRANNQFININLSKNVIYYSNNRNSYSAYNIISVDSTAGLYTITGKTQNGSKLFLIKRISPQAFELAVCENPQQHDCNRFQKMFLYYENKNRSAIYLPVTNSYAIHDLDKSQKNKLRRVIKNAGDTATVFLSNRYTQPPANTDINKYLGKEYAIVTKDAFEDNPFSRNYFTISRNTISNTNQSPIPSSTNSISTKTAKENIVKSNPGENKIAEPPKASGNEMEMGYLQFNDDNELNDASMQLVKQIAQQLKTNPSLKIKLYANWSNEDEQEIVTKNISALKNFYLKDEGISLLSNQITTYATNLKHPNEDVNKIYIKAIDLSKKP